MKCHFFQKQWVFQKINSTALEKIFSSNHFFRGVEVFLAKLPLSTQNVYHCFMKNQSIYTRIYTKKSAFPRRPIPAKVALSAPNGSEDIYIKRYNFFNCDTMYPHIFWYSISPYSLWLQLRDTLYINRHVDLKAIQNRKLEEMEINHHHEVETVDVS